MGQGARVRPRLPARLGGGPVPEPAVARRQRPRRSRGGAAPRLCRPHPGEAPAKIIHAANRRVRGLWQTSLPSRFIDELPPDHVEVEETEGAAALAATATRDSTRPASGRATRRRAPGGRRPGTDARTLRRAAHGARPGRSTPGRRPAPGPRRASRRARGSSTSSSGRAASSRPTARSSPSTSTAPAASW